MAPAQVETHEHRWQDAASPERMAAAAVIGGGLVLFAPMMYRWRLMGDYVPHAELIQLAAVDPLAFLRNTPHFLYHALAALLHRLLPIPVETAGFLVMTGAFLLLLLVLFHVLRRALPAGAAGAGAAACFSIALALATAITVFTPQNTYFGYLNPHVYHNPTMILMKPLALWLFFLALRVYDPGSDISRPVLRTLAYALLTGLCIVAKPSFILILLPALALLTAAQLLRGRHVTLWLLIGGIVLPAGAVLLVQTMTWTSSGGIGVAPLLTFVEWANHYEPAAADALGLKFLLSVAFPVTVCGLYWQQARRSLLLHAAWLCFLVGAAYTYLLVDYTMISAGDWTWSGQIGTFVLFAASAVFWLRQQRHELAADGAALREVLRRPRVLAVGTVFGLHLISGVYWYALHLTQPYLDLIYIWW